jgi:N-methylhydantoinase A
MPALRLGVDIGGTFADHLLFDEETGTVEAFKTLATHHDLSLCVLEGLSWFAQNRLEGVRGLALVAHGTTVNTNAILERRGARCGLVTTRGFRDVLEIGRQTRPKFYEWFVDRPEPLIPRYLRLEVDERVNTQGEVLVPLAEEDVHKAAETFREAGVQAVAVCLLNAYANATHERRIRDLLEQLLPGVYLAVSTELSPEFREFERTSTTAAAAYVGPVFEQYVQGLVQGLARELKPSPPLYIMQSSGGLVSATTVIERPHLTIESGPAAGVVAAAELGRRLRLKDLISFDMGGTSAKACLVRDGMPSRVGMLEVGAEASGFFGLRITGLPIMAPSIDLVECSAGGGSIGWVDVTGLLKVGPQSAGADPGPACYDAGGTRPTVTDAHVVLGRLSPDFFLGGRMVIRSELAAKSIQEHVAGPLGLSMHDAAQGLIDVANAKMVRTLRTVSVTRGFDPRHFTLVAHGGAGPLHAGDLAQELGIRQIIIPPNPGLFSALGLLHSRIDVNFSITRLTRAELKNLSVMEEKLREVQLYCQGRLDQEGVRHMDRTVDRSVDMRYVRQNFELEVSVPDGPLSAAALERLLQAFHDLHHRAYGHSNATDPVDVVNYKARGIGSLPKPELKELPEGPENADSAYLGSRPVFFKQAGWVECPYYDRVKLRASQKIVGPAVINEFDSTVVLLPGHRAGVTRFGDLVIDASQAEG